VCLEKIEHLVIIREIVDCLECLEKIEHLVIIREIIDVWIVFNKNNNLTFELFSIRITIWLLMFQQEILGYSKRDPIEAEAEGTLLI
jgi:hypothetical protein